MRASAAKQQALKLSTYDGGVLGARLHARATNCDVGLWWNEVYLRWHFEVLPKREYRCGWELRCEVVKPSDPL